MERGNWIILGMLILLAAPVSAELYKYVDKNGNVLYTDDVSQIPKEQRVGIGVFDETPSSADSTSKDINQQQEQAETRSAEDINEIWERLDREQEALVKEGVALQKEREELRKEKEELISSRRFKSGTDSIIKRKFKELNEKMEESKKKLEDYQKRKAAYEAEVREAKAMLKQPQNP